VDTSYRSAKGNWSARGSIQAPREKNACGAGEPPPAAPAASRRGSDLGGTLSRMMVSGASWICQSSCQHQQRHIGRLRLMWWDI
jgi:hypothetical protein